MTEKRKLPSTFFWGNSVSSIQTEGAWNEDGKGLSVYDIRGSTANSSDWHVAIDEYHRYDEDLDLIKDMNMNMYRIQISWSRVCPDGDGEFNQKGIDFYDRLINAMLKRGIEPMVCLYHFDMPLNLAKKYNGFMSRHVVDAFVRFGKKMIDHFADRVKYWIVFNEHNLYFQDEVFNISGYEHGDQSLDDMYTIFHHTMLAHIRIANYIHQHYQDVKIGGMLAYQQIYPETSKPSDVWAAKQVQEFLNFNIYDADTGQGYSPEVLQYVKNHHIQMDITQEDQVIMQKASCDFLAFSYYSSWVISAEKIPKGVAPNRYLNQGGVPSKYLKTNDWGWTIDPLGFKNAIITMYNHYHIPIFPIENGIGLKETWDGKHMIEDDERIAYHREHIKAMKDAIFIDGAQVLGYLGWGLIDIPSSHGDMEKRYGAVYVNRSNHDLKDLKRVPKKSFYWFQKVLKDNGDEL
ncbi:MULTISPECIES: glycoside hydrolase family 1 protein [Lactobacillus]|uniref:Glycoside hydrolase family 1 protein n=1 Tax=Lactobacillus xujianguonis TaxID=2495899 RepID=A0A437SUW6_9LACO|nr:MULTISPECIES: glycoside hydrolase family 1 protein [Lactobacillus]RVU70630.1 glycoside hydrolase family 1 protein [Lactobacillus xujianguonis]RVU73833.1 glycoside hydrolase family 1 protein [Lactobacillus xujianguonis]